MKLANYIGLFLACLVQWGFVPHASAGVFGLVALDPKGALDRWRGFHQAISSHVARDWQTLEFNVMNSDSSLLWSLLDGEVDIFVADPVIGLGLMNDGLALPVAFISPLQDTSNTPLSQQSCIVVRHDDRIDGLAALRGKSVVFERPNSGIGHAVPRRLLLDASLDLEEDPGIRDRRKQNSIAEQAADPSGLALDAGAKADHGEPNHNEARQSVRYVYAMDALSPVFWLTQEVVDAAAVRTGLLAKVERNAPGLVRRLRCSEPVPARLLMVRAELADMVSLGQALITLPEIVAGWHLTALSGTDDHRLTALFAANEALWHEMAETWRESPFAARRGGQQETRDLTGERDAGR